MILQPIIEGPLLYLAFIFFFGCLFMRVGIFSYTLLKSAPEKNEKVKFIVSSFAKVWLPAHRIVRLKPIYTGIRYAFHIGLFVVPVWFAGHVMLWEESIVDFGYASIGYEWSNRLSLIVLLVLLIFFLRRVISKEVRRESNRYDYLLLLIVSLPYLTGYLLTNAPLDNIANGLGIADAGAALWTLHIFSGEIMLVAAALLFVRTRINPELCLACVSCVSNCPTKALDSDDASTSQERNLKYSHYQCICCSNCMRICPENAIKLGHEISLMHLFRFVRKQIIHSENLCACVMCGSHFIPNAQYLRIQNVISTDTLNICPSCKRRQMVEPILRS